MLSPHKKSPPHTLCRTGFFQKSVYGVNVQLICSTQITRYPIGRLPLIMDVRMYDKGYVRLTALRRNVKPFSPTLRIGLNDLVPYLLMVNCHAGYMIRRVTRITITRKGCKPDIIVSGQYSVISQQINMSTNQQLTASARFIRAEGLN